jgi:hypothetical protein
MLTWHICVIVDLSFFTRLLTIECLYVVVSILDTGVGIARELTRLGRFSLTR